MPTNPPPPSPSNDSNNTVDTITTQVQDLYNIVDSFEECIFALKKAIVEIDEKTKMIPVTRRNSDTSATSNLSLPDYQGNPITVGDTVYTLHKGGYEERVGKVVEVNPATRYVSFTFASGRGGTRRLSKNLKKLND